MAKAKGRIARVKRRVLTSLQPKKPRSLSDYRKLGWKVLRGVGGKIYNRKTTAQNMRESLIAKSARFYETKYVKHPTKELWAVIWRPYPRKASEHRDIYR